MRPSRRRSRVASDRSAILRAPMTAMAVHPEQSRLVEETSETAAVDDPDLEYLRAHIAGGAA